MKVVIGLKRLMQGFCLLSLITIIYASLTIENCEAPVLSTIVQFAESSDGALLMLSCFALSICSLIWLSACYSRKTCYSSINRANKSQWWTIFGCSFWLFVLVLVLRAFASDFYPCGVP